MPSETINDLSASGKFSVEHGLAITTVGTTTMPYRLVPADALRISRGVDWVFPVVWYDSDAAPKDVSTGFTASFTISNGPSGTAYVTLTNATNAGITLAASEPTILLTRSAVQTAAMTFTRAWCELTLTQTVGGRTWRLFEGFCDLVK